MFSNSGTGNFQNNTSITPVRVGDIGMGIEPGIEKVFVGASKNEPSNIKKVDTSFSRIKGKEQDYVASRVNKNYLNSQPKTDTGVKEIFTNCPWSKIFLIVGVLLLLTAGALAFYFLYYKKHHIVIPSGPGYDDALTQAQSIVSNLQNVFNSSNIVYPSLHYSSVKLHYLRHHL